MNQIRNTLAMLSCIVMFFGFLPGGNALAGAERINQAGEERAEMPASLQDAFFAASSKPFTMQGGIHTTEYNGLGYKLNVEGLQAEGNEIQWNISLQGMGRGNHADDVPAPEIIQSETRLEYRRGNLVEWYRNTTIGVEQGFVINESPKGNGRLVLHLDISTDLEGKLDSDERGISFAGADGKTLRYDQLKAYDANGAELDAKMIYDPAQVVIQVDDRNAAYPITIDPLIYLEQKVIALDGATDDYFGYSVAIDGNTAVVGMPNDDIGANTEQGSAYILVRSGTTWIQQAKLTASDGATDDYFGHSVALSGDIALVGAYLDDVGANVDQGSAYIFVRSGTTWSENAKLTASDGVTYDNFGGSVALSGDTALVGAYSDDVGASNDQGSAYAFVRIAGAWAQQAKLTASDGAAGDHFGWSVALSSDTALVGAYSDDVGANIDQGSAYVFVRSGATWSQQTQLTFSDGASNFDFFGRSVALSGDTALVGADGYNLQHGSAFVFVRNGIAWSQQAVLNASDSVSWFRFGYSVALSGDVALVGVPDWNYAYVFVRNVTTWSQQAKLIASDGAGGTRFGYSVALSGDTALVGAYFDDIGGNVNQGSAYFYQAYRTDSDLAVSAASNAANPLYPGETVILTTTVTNYGPASASAVMLNASLPAGLTYVSHAATFGSYTPATGAWSLGSLGLGITATLMIEATVGSVSAPALNFTPYLLSRDTNDANNSASAQIPIAYSSYSLTPKKVYFDTQAVGTKSSEEIITFSNTGNVPLASNGFNFIGESTEFSIDSSNCSYVPGLWLGPGEACTIKVSFFPESIGDKSLKILVGVDNANSVDLYGTGVTPSISLMTLNPASLDFGNVFEGSNSLDQYIALTNIGTAPLNIASINLVGTDKTNFKLYNSSTCPLAGGTVAVGNSCVIDVSFAPYMTGNGSKMAVLQIISDAVDSPHSVILKGVSVMITHSLAINPATKDFGGVKVGLASTKQVFTITNTSNVGIFYVGTPISISGTNPTSFTISGDTCSLAMLSVGASCTVEVTFSPKAAGDLSATMEVAGYYSIPLTGRGLLERVLNGGFNTYKATSKIPSGWVASKFASTDGKDTTATNRKEGTASVKIANTTAVTKTLTQTIPLSGSAGDPFILSYWVKGKLLPAKGLCQVQVLFNGGAAGTKTLSCGLKGTFTYKNKTLSFTAPGAYSSVTVKITYSKASGTVWFDALSLLR